MRIKQAMSFYANCLLCPRRCNVNRESGQRGYCHETSALRLAFAGIHRGEEPSVTGLGGSGTIFVSGCNLGCAFCQNYQISMGNGLGQPVDNQGFAKICLMLQEQGVENINIVTGSHAAPALARGIGTAREQGLVIPVLWNSSGYDGVEALDLIRDFVDVYLPDLKTLDSNVAARFFNAPDYPDAAALAILRMMEFRDLRFRPGPDKSLGTLISGVMVRHLVIPGHLDATRQVLAWFSEHCRGRALLSLMTQYTPVQGSKGTDIPGTYVSKKEYQALLSMLDEFGIEDGFCQELVTGSSWLPDFTRDHPFSSDLSVPVWHWQRGFIIPQKTHSNN